MDFYDGDVMDGLDNTPVNEELEYDSKKDQDEEQEESEEFEQEVQEEQIEEVQTVQEIYRELSEPEIRLGKANLYQKVINMDLFNEGDSELCSIVEGEIREFCIRQIDKLMGYRDPEPRRPQRIQQNPIRKPQVQQRFATPNPQRTIPRQIIKPVIKVLPRPTRQSSIEPIQASKTPNTSASTNPLFNRKGPPPAADEIIEQGGKRYKVKWTSLVPNEYGTKQQKIINNLGPDNHVILKTVTGEPLIQVVSDSGGDKYKVIYSLLTPPPRDVAALPMPSGPAMEAIMMNRAAQASGSLGRITSQIVDIAVNS